MKFRLYKFNYIGKDDIIGSLTWKNFPLLNDSIHIPFTRQCYVIIESDKSNLMPDKFIVPAPSQKPGILFIQPLGESVEVDLSKKHVEISLEFICGDDIKEKISKEINSNKSYNILLATSNVVREFEEKIREDRQ